MFTASSGGFSNVSLMTGGIEAIGHGIYIDDKTLDGAMKSLEGKSLRSYLKHDGAGGDRLGNEIGFFSGIYKEGQKLKAKTFEFLDSFKADAKATYEKLVELAQKVPDQFGVSLVLEYKPVWVMGNGEEFNARLGEPAPAGAVRPVPSVRISNVVSADLVQRPAANPNGLLSVDGPRTSKVSMDSEIKPAALEQDANVALLAAKDTEIVSLKAEFAKLGEQHKVALQEKDTMIGDLLGQKAKLEASVAELSKIRDESAAKIDELASFDARNLGIAPVKVAAAQLARKSGGLKTPEEKLAAYEAMPDGKDKDAFRKLHRDALFAAFSSRK